VGKRVADPGREGPRESIGKGREMRQERRKRRGARRGTWEHAYI